MSDLAASSEFPARLKQYLRGTFVKAAFAFVWIGGLAHIPATILLLVMGYTNAAMLGFTLALALYMAPPPSSETMEGIRQWMNASHKYMFKKTSWVPEDPKWSDHAFDGGSPTMIGYHPHGIFCWGFILHGGLLDGVMPLTGLVAHALFLQPLFRYVFETCFKCVGTVSKTSMIERMKRKESFGLLPGGFQEATIMKWGHERVFLKRRQGFVKYALQFGYKLVPAYTFGESDTYWTVCGGLKWRLKLNEWSLPGVMCVGKWWCPAMPRDDCELHTVYGKPIVLPTIQNPSKQDVDHWHQVYMKELVALFDRNKKWASKRGEAAQLEIY